MGSRISVIAVVASVVCSASCGFADDVFLLSYFKGNGETGVYLAASDDGLTFKDLNEGGRCLRRPSGRGRT